MKLSDWIDEYRRFDPNGVARTVAEPEDDWLEEELLAPADRVRDTRPRWMSRARRVGYARPTQL